MGGVLDDADGESYWYGAGAVLALPPFLITSGLAAVGARLNKMLRGDWSPAAMRVDREIQCASGPSLASPTLPLALTLPRP